MPVQDAKIRATNFNEVALGYSTKVAIDEAHRCLQCPNKPCQTGCPVEIDIPVFIKKIEDNDFDGSYNELAKWTSLPAVCGRVCPQESQCEAVCVRGKRGESVAIGRLERFVADEHIKNASSQNTKADVKKSNGKKVAIVGSGPSGLAAAGVLVDKGYDVTIFEALHKAGGVLVYGIPEFRLPKSIVDGEINALVDKGVKLETNMVIGKILTVDELFENGFKAVFIGTGAGLPKFMNIPGENLNGVLSANEFLTRVNLMKAYKNNASTPVVKAEKVTVVGGGNVAMDSARCALRLNAKEVTIVYRRGMEELPARKEEIEHASEEGIIFKTLTSPIEIIGDKNGYVKKMICLKYELGEVDASGRRRPVPIKGSEFEIETDTVIMSIGTSPNPLIKSTTSDIDVQSWGGIDADTSGKTSKEGVWAGGDAVTGAATVILAMGAGKKAALAIDEYLSNK
jgi:glutamate synthase (NADPH/NADH) small chain